MGSALISEMTLFPVILARMLYILLAHHLYTSGSNGQLDLQTFLFRIAGLVC
jgi:hypothetical protein